MENMSTERCACMCAGRGEVAGPEAVVEAVRLAAACLAPARAACLGTLSDVVCAAKFV